MNGRNRHRQITIAALVLLVLGGGLWWSTRPRIDPRLVGTWYYVFDRPVSGVAIGRRYLSDGTAFDFYDNDASVPTFPPGWTDSPFERWKVEDGVLIEQSAFRGGLEGVKQRLAEVWHSISGGPTDELRSRVLEATTTILRIERLNAPIQAKGHMNPVTTLSRVHDG